MIFTGRWPKRCRRPGRRADTAITCLRMASIWLSPVAEFDVEGDVVAVDPMFLTALPASIRPYWGRWLGRGRRLISCSVR